MKDNIDNGLNPIIAQAIEETKAEAGSSFQLEKINFVELERCGFYHLPSDRNTSSVWGE